MTPHDDARKVVQVGDVEWPWLATISASSTLGEAAGLMRALNIGSVAVNRDHTIIGIVTEHDIVRAAVGKTDLDGTPVTTYMSPDPATVSIDADVEQAALTMVAVGARHLPVVDGDRVVGMISARDLLQALAGNVEPHAPRNYRKWWGRLLDRRPKLAAGTEWR